MSILGFGASALGGVFHDVTEEECISVVHAALKAGINVIDTAPWYGQGRSEEMLGKALKGVPREAYMLNTKVGRYEQEVENMFDYSAVRMERSVDESLARMGVDFIDCIQVRRNSSLRMARFRLFPIPFSFATAQNVGWLSSIALARTCKGVTAVPAMEHMPHLDTVTGARHGVQPQSRHYHQQYPSSFGPVSLSSHPGFGLKPQHH